MWQFQSNSAPDRGDAGKAGTEPGQGTCTADWGGDGITWTAHFRDTAPRLSVRFIDQGVDEAQPELLAWQPQAELVSLETDDVYVRGDDLIASYSAPNSPFRRQFYWRHLPGPQSMETIFSLQNQELHGALVARIRSRLPATQAWLSSQGGQFLPMTLDSRQHLSISDGWIAVPLRHGRIYLEQLHPTDFRSGSVCVRDGRLEIVWELFGDPIEKGVIRRARARAEFLSSVDFSPQLVAQRREQFAASPIPLTA
ncbi:MAG: hypothetical protein FJ295_14920 [Planctomycetes bacterium]|nr:hypothetical protein [Planctomycetota bacterium]